MILKRRKEAFQLSVSGKVFWGSDQVSLQQQVKSLQKEHVYKGIGGFSFLLTKIGKVGECIISFHHHLQSFRYSKTVHVHFSKF